MYGRQQGYKRKWSGSSKGSKKGWKRYARSYFLFFYPLSFRARSANRTRKALGAPRSTYAGLAARPSVGTGTFALSTSISRLGTIFPDRIFVPMRYSTRIGFTIASGVPQGNAFRGNSVYDPDQTGSGHKAYGFDQLSSYYGAFRVVNSTCRVVMMPQTGTSLATQCLIFGLRANVSPTLNVSDIAAWTETGNGCYAVTNSTGYGAFGKGAQPALSMKRSSAKMLGLTDIQVNTDPNTEGTSSADPLNQWYWQLYVNTADGLTSATALADVSITYHALWTYKLEQPSS